MSVMGFKIETNSSKKKENNVIPAADFQHVLCVGATGSGKTASFILPTLEERIQRGHVVIFFDHKGHEHKKVKYLAKKAGRLDDVVEIGKPHASYINLMAELDTIRLKEMIRGNSMSKDPYWANSAANLMEDIIMLLRRLRTVVKTLQSFKEFDEKIVDILQGLHDYGIDMHEEPSFQTLAKIIATPQKLSEFKEVVSVIPNALAAMLDDHNVAEGEEYHKLRLVSGKILTLKNALSASDRFTISQSKSDTNSGNNAVLQHLDNTIAAYAKKDYININQYTISELMQKNAIIIVDTQSFGDDIMKVFLESILKKAVMRLRTGNTAAMSVFIDEANRVLFPSIDLHSDVLREAKVELILAIQNEEQMISKFSQTVWDSIKLNIKHQYAIDIAHRISYNSGEYMFTKPMRLDENVLYEAEYDYYGLTGNQANIQKHFLGELEHLPKDFTVVYDLDIFEHDASVYLEGKDGERHLYIYFGEAIVKQVDHTFPMPERSKVHYEDVKMDFTLEEEMEMLNRVRSQNDADEKWWYDDFYFDDDDAIDF